MELLQAIANHAGVRLSQVKQASETKCYIDEAVNAASFKFENKTISFRQSLVGTTAYIEDSE